jgi:small conductance mechanosensitive channel
MIEIALKLLPTAALVILVAVVLSVLDRILRRRLTSSDKGFQHQLIMLLAGAVGLFSFLLVIPISDLLRGQLLGLIGIVASAAIALSSTTFLGNALAGIMLRILQNFRIGDFIQVGDHLGRVTSRGLFHTEIQTNNRQLVTLPNLYLVTNAVTTIQESGTVVRADISLGYDIPHTEIEKLLVEAAEAAKLEDPFVRIITLGDFSVTYQAAGILRDVKTFFSAQSNLKGCILDRLHRAGVEIVSPTFMNQRPLGPDKKFIPVTAAATPQAPPDDVPEAKLFDKADEAESLADMRDNIERIEKEIVEFKNQRKSAADQAEKETVELKISQLETEKERQKVVIEEKEAKAREK